LLARAEAQQQAAELHAEGFEVNGWRDVPGPPIFHADAFRSRAFDFHELAIRLVWNGFTDEPSNPSGWQRMSDAEDRRLRCVWTPAVEKSMNGFPRENHQSFAV
jgi:hypothetical protein